MARLSDPVNFSASPTEQKHLVGVVIEIPEPYRSQLQEMRTACEDGQGWSTPPHITLVPPTVLTETERAAIPGHLAAVAAKHHRFELELSGMATFRPVSPVVYARVTDGAARCAELEEDVRTGPLAVEVRFDYHPHVTVAHNRPDPVLDRAMFEYRAFHARFEISSFECFEWSDNDWQLQDAYVLADPGLKGR